MKDFRGKELKVGDKVITVIRGSRGIRCLAETEVTGFTPKMVRTKRGLRTTNNVVIVKD